MNNNTVGFRNGDLILKNITFDYTNANQGAQPGVVKLDGQLLIGCAQSNPNPNIAMTVGKIRSPGATILVGYEFVAGQSNITVDVAGAGLLATLTGNTGGPISPTLGNINIVTANTTVKIAGNSGTSTLLEDFGLSNLLLGSNGAITTGSDNCGFGLSALASVTAGDLNCAFGLGALNLNQVGGSNVAIGAGVLFHLAPAGGSNVSTNNTGVGTDSLGFLTTGTNNTCIGNFSGFNYTSSESSNILVAHQGVLAESNTTRIGTQGSGAAQQNRAFMAGIYNVVVASSQPVAIDPNGQLNTLGFGTATQVLTSNGAGNSPTWQAASGGTAITLTGNTGGPVGPTLGNFNIITSNTTVLVTGNPGTSTLTMNYGVSNLLLGSSGSFTGGSANNGFGRFALGLDTVGVANCAFGTNALSLNTTGGSNVAIGNSALLNFNPGGLSNVVTSNVCVGTTSLNNLATGTNNTCIGDSAGTNYNAAESSNILVGSAGVAAESNSIRVGTQGAGAGQQNRAFMAGIYNVVVPSSQPVGVDTNGQLNTLGFGTAGQVLTSNGAGTSPTFQSIVTPVATLNLVDDFLFSANVNNTGLNSFGELPWSHSATAPFTTTAPANDSNHPGVVASAAISADFLALIAGDNQNNIVLGGGALTLVWVVFIDALSTSINRYVMGIGLADTIISTVANGVYFQYSDNINSGQWVLKTTSLSATTTTNTSIAVTTGWHVLKLVVNAAGTSVVFTIDGVSQAAVTTHIPVIDAVTPFWIMTWVSGTMGAGTIQIDLMSLQLTLTNPRF